MGLNMQMITRGWLVLRLADDSPLALALVMVSFAAPMTFMSLIGGALADRIPRKRLLMLSQGGNAVLTILLATLDVTGVVTFWHVMVIGVANGSMMAFNMPSRTAIISDIVPEHRLMNAISLNNSGMNLTRIVGPAAAGVLIVFIGTAGVFYLVGAIYVLAFLLVAGMQAGSTVSTRARKGIFEDIREGLSYTIRDQTLRGLIIMTFIPVLFGFSYFALLPAWAREALDVGSEDLGILMMLMGVGALIGSLVLASMTNFKKRGLFLLAASLGWGVSLAVFSQATSYALAVPLLMFMGLVSSLYMSLSMTLTQLHASAEMRGRIMSINMMTFGLMPLGALPFGALAERIGTPDALGLSGLMLAALTVLFALAYPSFRRIA
jgi:MFS family permease